MPDRVVSKLSDLLPPSDAEIVPLLAGAGDLVVPLLGFTDGLSDDQIRYSIETLADIDTMESRQMALEYFSRASVNDVLIDAALDTVHYIDEGDFSREIVRRLTRRNSPAFYQSARGGVLRVADLDIRLFLKYLPRFSTIRFDGTQRDIALKFLDELKEDFERIKRIDIINCGEGTTVRLEALRKLRWLQEINFFKVAKIFDLNFLSSLDNVTSIGMVCVDEIYDAEGVHYPTQLEKVL